MFVQVHLVADRGGLVPHDEVEHVTQEILSNVSPNVTASSSAIVNGHTRILFSASEADSDAVVAAATSVDSSSLRETDEIVVDTNWEHPKEHPNWNIEGNR